MNVVVASMLANKVANPSINFSKNWNNKLSNHVFTTIRKYTEEKHNYYLDRVDHEFDILLMGDKYTTAYLIDCYRQTLKDLDELVVEQDVGIYNGMGYQVNPAFHEFKKFGVEADDDVLVLVLADKLKRKQTLKVL